MLQLPCRMVHWLLQLVVVIDIITENYVEHMVVVDSNCNPSINYIVDNFRIKMIFHF